ncbi:alpha/beta hydrolase [Luteitalea sp.]|jgi:alpha-L-fucosidase 2|uniref:alpha/beta hydrolase n=1 Tax=Luteitalea sp. TaxID=2004800 RepID=UPI0037C70D95
MHTLRSTGLVAACLAGALAFGAAAHPASGQPAPNGCLPLTPTGTQGGALLPGGLMNVRFGGTERYPIALDVYPHADAATRPIAVVLRGGKGTIGQRSSYVGQLVELFGDAGYVVATIDYHAPSLDAASEDLTSALRMLTKCHAAALHVDQYKTVLVAEDSAAPMALLVAARLRELRLGRFAGAPAPPASVVVVGGRFTDAPAPAVPTRIIHGGADSEVPIAQARALCARATAGCDVVEVPGASHRVENWWPSQWGYKAALLSSLASQVGTVPPAARAASPGTGLRKRIVYDAANRLALDAWVPSTPGPHGAVVLVHGGGWEAGDRVTYIAPMLALAASKGLAWVSIDYRLTPDVTNREQVADVKAALQYVRTHAADLRIDPARLVLVGESASGQLVAHVAGSEPSLAGVVSFYGVYDLEAMAGDPANPRSLARRLFRITSLDAASVATLREYSPQHQARKTLPPMLLAVGTADRLAVQQRAYLARLTATGADVQGVEIDGAPHGMEAWHEEPAWRVWETKVGDWISARTGAKKP